MLALSHTVSVFDPQRQTLLHDIEARDGARPLEITRDRYVQFARDTGPKRILIAEKP